ncbi:hypothetical protein QE152_g39824 [Popillia japonica]|uniref:Uncharacterized protein n=1 Tax=Popillia japonica TaxID=7064 RepID=A0AAW1HTL6_POPJA
MVLRNCGIQPFDPFVFNESDFVPAKTTERLLRQSEAPCIDRPGDQYESEDDISLQDLAKTKGNTDKTSGAGTLVSQDVEPPLDPDSETRVLHQIGPLPKAERK